MSGAEIVVLGLKSLKVLVTSLCPAQPSQKVLITSLCPAQPAQQLLPYVEITEQFTQWTVAFVTDWPPVVTFVTDWSPVVRFVTDWPPVVTTQGSYPSSGC